MKFDIIARTQGWTTLVIQNAYAFDADAVAVQDWLIELIIGEGGPEVLPKLTRHQGAILRACLAEYRADQAAWFEAWDAAQDELYT